MVEMDRISQALKEGGRIAQDCRLLMFETSDAGCQLGKDVATRNHKFQDAKWTKLQRY